MIIMEIPMKNATEAIRMKRILRSEGIRAYVSKRSGEEGCFFLLIVSEKMYPDALNILEKYK